MLKLRHTIHTRPSERGLQGVLAGNPVRDRALVKAPHKVQADMSGFPGQQNTTQYSVMGSGGQQYDLLMSGIVSDDDQANLRFYRDIYRYDNTSGSAVDLLSILPFSDYDLIGSDKARNKVYETATERLNLKTAMTPMSVEYFVTGMFTGTLMYRSDRKQFTEMMPHKREDTTITPSPFFGIEPSIEVRQSPVVQKFLQSQDPRFTRMLQGLNAKFRKALEAPSMLLDASTTLYIPRMAEASNLIGMSLYKRILPIYLIEKALYKGTLIEAQRRQRSLLHLAVGDEEWEPTSEELQAIVSLFQQADLDPLGAIIATRHGVDAQELRQGGDFWKYTDMTDALSPMKLRALSISETFLSGEANYSSMEVSLSVFLDWINNHRNQFTQEVFYNKILPIVAVTNGFYKKGASAEQTAGIRDQIKLQYQINDPSILDIPEVQWKKQLRPTANKDYMELLTTMEEKGLPIGLRMWAAAGGLDAESVIKQSEEEDALRKRVEKLKAKGVQVGGESGPGGGDAGDAGDSAFARLIQSNTAGGKLRTRTDYDTIVNEVRGKTPTGKAKYIYNQRGAREKLHVLANAALKRLSETYVAPSARRA
jgi:hypothetical protein